MFRPWGQGNQIGTLYKLTSEEIQNRMGHNSVTIGEIPLKVGTQLITLDKKSVLDVGDLLLCVAHTGDYFFDYELIYFVSDNLFPNYPPSKKDKKGTLNIVKNMTLGAYCLSQESKFQLTKQQYHSLLANGKIEINKDDLK